MTMEPLPDHPVIRAMERTGYPPRGGTTKGKEPKHGEELYRGPALLP